MLIRLAALGTLGYAAYRYYQKNSGANLGDSSRTADDQFAEIQLAGGPLSPQATVQHSPELP